MSSGQWEALPQRTRRRRTAASTPAGEGPGSLPCPPQPHEAATAAQSSPPAPPKAAAAAGRTAVAEEAPGPARRESVPRAGDGDRQQEQHQQHRLGSSSSGSSSSIRRADASEPPPQNPREDGGVQGLKPGEEGQHEEFSHGNPSSVGRGGSRPPLGTPATSAGEKRIGEEGGEEGGIREGVAADAATMSARHAAVATAVDERSKMARFSEGLGGGAGADGGADGEANFEYLDHTADVQLHSWGDSIERAMEGALAAMFNTITDIAKVDIDPSLTKSLDIEGHDAKSLLFSLLDEFLFLFHSEGLVVKKATINGVVDRADGKGGGNDRGEGGGDGSGGDDRTTSTRWRIRATAEGETFDLAKHPQGTEVKAITYSNMQINEIPGGRTDIYVIVDI